MAEQVPSVGRIVHFVYGGQHVPAIITDPAFVCNDVETGSEVTRVALTVFLPNAAPFTTVAAHGDEVGPGTWENATWHWPEYVPAKEG